MRTQMIRRSRRGFTLIEILIVVVILGILAAIVIPQFTDAADDAEMQAARSTLQTVRSQFELCRFKGDCNDCGTYADVPAIIADLTGNGYLSSDATLPTGFAWAAGCPIGLQDNAATGPDESTW